jgi:L-2-hydroxyglutarate oxidase LhgO
MSHVNYSADINTDFLIVGAGIVGLSVAWELRKRNPLATITILEKEPEVGLHASGRNSGVLHSGIYYGSDTLKAKVCSAGAKKMQTFADEYGIACKKSGKIIIATSESDLPTIERLLKNATDNGIKAERLNEKEIAEIEPYATPYQAGIYSPDTAVIDSKSVVKKLYSLLKDKGVRFELNSPLLEQNEKGKTVSIPNKTISYGYLYNCAGANADRVAKLFGQGFDYTMVPFKGIYYKLRKERGYLVNGNIYPVPDINLPFLGVHLTRVINGDVYVGPTAIPAFGRENYGILQGMELGEGFKISSELISMYLKNKSNFRLLVHTEIRKYLKPWFLKSAQKLMAELKSEDLIPSNKVGIRPQLVNVKTKSIEMDYIIEQTENSTHILNSISPAFTSSFAFAEWIVDQSEVRV